MGLAASFECDGTVIDDDLLGIAKRNIGLPVSIQADDHDRYQKKIDAFKQEIE